MNLTIRDRIDLMVRLGDYIRSGDQELQDLELLAYHRNGWFIPEFVRLALDRIAAEFLDLDKLNRWVAGYPALAHERSVKNVGIVMAGNIPAVGFHDFLCGFLSGHTLLLKLSSRDEVLLLHFIGLLKSWAPGLEGRIEVREMLRGADAYIATGSNNSARYFHYYFGKYPHLIRQNRTSVAVLDGSESAEELERLADDVFAYFGLGCRNVTKILVPESYDFVPLLESFKRYDYLMDYHHYKNNFDYNLSIALLNKEHYMTNGTLLLLERDAVYSRIGVLHYARCPDPLEASRSLGDDEAIQCVVGHGHLPFGMAQAPGLADYADGVDTLAFLTSLS